MRTEIRRFVRESPANRTRDQAGPYFEEPLVGFASADDPLFATFKTIIGEFHQTPQEVMAGVLGHGARAATVVVWVLPISRATRVSNRRESRVPSREWAHTRTYGEQLNVSLRRHLVDRLAALGHRAVAPVLCPTWKELSGTPVGIASTWSERHAAFVAGLGTFSLNDSLITARGTAHRLGSVITDLPVPPSSRDYAGHLDHCLHFREGTCGVCIDRCPAGALSQSGHDKNRCRQFVYGTSPAAVSELYGVAQTACGLCQTKVPCEARVPPPSRLSLSRR
jgi:epoxyqueuosine reductase QueG